MANVKICVILLFACATYYIKESQAQKPEIAYLGRFLFKLGTSFIPRGCPAPQPVAGEFPEEDEDFETTSLPEEPIAAAEETTEEFTEEETTGEPEEETTGEPEEGEETTIEPEAR